MNEGQIERLLQSADGMSGAPAFGRITAAQVRRRIRRKRFTTVAVPLSIAALALLATALWTHCMQTEKARPEPVAPRIASLENQVRQLQEQTTATLRLVQEMLEKDRQQRRLAALEAELASIPDPMQEIERQVDETAFILLYQADRLYKELNQRESAVAAYKEVIQLFPDNQWADVARERLAQIEQRQINKSDRPERQGDIPCEPRRV